MRIIGFCIMKTTKIILSSHMQKQTNEWVSRELCKENNKERQKEEEITSALDRNGCPLDLERNF